MSTKQIYATATYEKTDGSTTEASSPKPDTESFKILSIEGPYNDNDELIDYVDKTKRYKYYLTLDRDPKSVKRKDRKRIKWAVSYDGAGVDGAKVFIKLNGNPITSARVEDNKIAIYLQTQFADKTFTIHAYTGELDSEDVSITVSADYNQYKALLAEGDRCVTPSNVTLANNGTTDPPEKEFELKKGVRLYFLRYGLFLGEDHGGGDVESIGELASKNIEKYLKGKLPKFDNLHCHLTDLYSGGYIYIIDPEKDKPKDSFEYKILPTQKLEEIPWYKKDVRTLMGSKRNQRQSGALPYHPLEYLEDDPAPKRYVCYSPIQWSAAYYTKVCKETSLQKERMIEVECSGIPQGQLNINEEILAYDGVSAVFNKDAIACKRLRNKITFLDQKHDSEADYKPDMFIPLFDALSVADDVAEVLNEEVIQHQANIEAIRFGRCPDDVAYRIRNEKQKPDTKVEAEIKIETLTDTEKEINDMFTLALTTYQLVYNDEKSIHKFDGGSIGWNMSDLHYNQEYKEYFEWHGNSGGTRNNKHYIGYGIHGEKIKNVLGVDERKKQRQTIRNIQKDFAALLQSNYFDKHLQDYYAEDNTLCAFLGKETIAGYIALLSVNPHHFDRSLDLRADYEKNHDWHSWIQNIFTCESPKTGVEKIVDFKIDITDEFEHNIGYLGIKLPRKMASFAGKIIKSLGNMTTTIPAQQIEHLMELTVSRLNTTTYKGMTMYNFVRQQVHNALPANHNINIAEGAGNTSLNRTQTLRFPAAAIVMKHSSRGSHTFVLPTVQEIAMQEGVPTTTATRMQTILNSNAFNGTILALQVLNLGYAFKKYAEDDTFKNTFNLAGAVATFTDAVLKMPAVNARITTVVPSTTRLGAMILRGPGIAGSGIGAIMCFWDGAEKMAARDADAALMYYGAGVASLGVTVATIFASTSWAGPVGWICAGITVGFLVLAYLFTDTPLQKFFKRFMFNDTVAFPLEGRPVWQYNIAIYNDRENQLGKDNDMPYLADPTRAAAELHDLLVSARITFAHDKESFLRVKHDTYTMGKYPSTLTTAYASRFKVTMYCNTLLEQKEQLEHELYFFRNGIGGSSKPVQVHNNPVFVAASKDTPAHLKLDLNFSEQFINQCIPQSCLLLICRLELYQNPFVKVPNHNYYPVNYNNKDRYIGAMVGMRYISQTRIISIDASYKSPTRIGTKNQLKGRKIWKKN